METDFTLRFLPVSDHGSERFVTVFDRGGPVESNLGDHVVLRSASAAL